MPRRKDRRWRLIEKASPQAGYFTAAEALEAGYSYAAQRYHRLQGNWLRAVRGIYRLAEWPSSAHEDLVRWTLWSGGTAVVSHETALSVHDLGDVNPKKIHLTVPPRFRAKAPEVVLHRATLRPSEVEEREGFIVTTPLRSLVDVAAGSLDLDQLATAVSEAVEQGLVTHRQLRNQADGVSDRAALRIERSLGLAMAPKRRRAPPPAGKPSKRASVVTRGVNRKLPTRRSLFRKA